MNIAFGAVVTVLTQEFMLHYNRKGLQHSYSYLFIRVYEFWL